MPEKEQPVELIDINKLFLDGSTGAFATETTEAERKEIVARINGFRIDDDKKRFADIYIFSGGDVAKSYMTVWGGEKGWNSYQCRKAGERLLAKDKDVLNYLDFIREQSLAAMGFSDKAESYMLAIVDELVSGMQGDIFDYISIKGDDVSVVDINTLTKAQRKRVKRLRLTTTDLKGGGKKTVVDIELWDKQKYMDMMMKHLKMFTTRSFGTNTSEKVEKVISKAEQDIERVYSGNTIEDVEYTEEAKNEDE